MPNPAVAAIARWEWARSRRALLVFGVVGGLLGGLVVGGAALTRRTISAPDRLFETVAPGDVHLRVFDAGVVQKTLELPEVEAAWVGGVAVGRIEGAPVLSYAGVVASTEVIGRMVEPVVVEGRAAQPDDEREVVLTESVAEFYGVAVGGTLTLAMLSAEEIFQFDTGFGEPDGPTVALAVVGLVRVPPGVFDGTPVIATPAFAAAHADLFPGYDIRLQLRGGDAAFAGVVEEVNRLAAPTAEPEDDDFAQVAADRPRDGTDDLSHSSRVLFAGLIAAVVVAGLAVAAGLAQAWSRHHGAGASTQHVESALGLTSGGRVLARVLPAGFAAVVAGSVAALVGIAASRQQPVGSLGRVEPQTGWRLDVAAVAVGGVAVAVAMGLLAAATAWRAGRTPGADLDGRRARRLRAVPSRHGWPLAGAAFALTSGGGRHVPVRMSLIGAVLGVAGLVGSLSFSASLDRLVDTPARWGWDADFSIADVNDDIIAAAVADPRLDAVSDLYAAEATIGGRPSDAYAVRKRSGDTGWVLQQGRQPASPTEVVLGGKIARQLHARIGDEVVVGDGMRFTVVGLGLGPASNLESMGTSALFTYEGLSTISTTSLFREALVRVRPDADLDAVLADYSQYEIVERSLPNAVRDVSELGSLPALLGAFLALLAAIALLHALVVTAGSRARDLAVLRALGATPAQSGLAILAMGITTAVIGIAGGLPIGYALARLLWGEVARSIGVEGDVAVPWTTLPVLTGTVVAAAIIAAIPAIRAARQPPGQVLRAG